MQRKKWKKNRQTIKKDNWNFKWNKKCLKNERKKKEKKNKKTKKQKKRKEKSNVSNPKNIFENECHWKP